MSEATATLTTTEQAEKTEAELLTLRKLRDELLTTKATQREKIKQLESELLQANERANTAESHVSELTVQRPLKAMAESLSKAPQSFIEMFTRDFRVEMQNGELQLLHAKDGKPVMDGDKPVPFEREPLLRLLQTTSTGAAKELWTHTLIVGKASGGVGRPTFDHSRRPPTANDPEEKKPVAHSFGLR